jgi:hypothetical protein
MVNDDPPGSKSTNDDASKQVEEATATATATATAVADQVKPTEGEEAVTNGAPAQVQVTATAPSQVAEPQEAEDDNADDDEEGSTGTDDNEKTAAADSPGYSADQSMQESGVLQEHIAVRKHHSPTPAESVAAATEVVTETMTEAARDTLMAPVVIQGLSADDIVSHHMLVNELSFSRPQDMDMDMDPQQQQQGDKEESKVDPDPMQDSEQPVQYVNVGLAHWEKQRLEWLAMNRNTVSKYENAEEAAASLDGKFQAIPVDVDEIIDVIFQSPKQWREEGGPRRFPCAVPLPQMVDILQDLWEAEGLDT